MTEQEFEIGRNFGAGIFYTYNVLKHNPNSSVIDLAIESGLTDRVLKVHLKTLLDSGIIQREKKKLRYCQGYVYKITETWKLQ